MQLYHLDDDLGETRNLAAENRELATAMRATLEKIIREGRSTPGTIQPNDVEVIRFPRSDVATGKGKGKAK